MARQLIAVDGPDARDFLQGLITNDIARAEREGIVWAGLLTPQGKYLADFFVITRLEGGFWLDAEADQAPALIQRLSMYKLRSNVTLKPVDVPVARGTGPAPEGALADPRDPTLGWRLYGSDRDDATDWDALRVAAVIPETGIELTPDTFILEAGFERLHGVDFRKGCYVGQEVTARMKHKTELRKGLMQVALGGTVPVGTPITREGREVGTVFTQSGGRAIAQMRFDRIGEGMEAAGVPVTAAPPG